MHIATISSNPEAGHARFTECHRVVTGLLWLATAAVVYLISLWLIKRHPDWSPATRVALTLTPLLPGIFYLRALLKSFSQMDELQRRIQMEALGFALLGTIVVMTTVNVCAEQGVRVVNDPHGLGIGGVYLTVFILWSIGVSISTFRYR